MDHPQMLKADKKTEKALSSLPTAPRITET
jgi:hypothetical protein